MKRLVNLFYNLRELSHFRLLRSPTPPTPPPMAKPTPSPSPPLAKPSAPPPVASVPLNQPDPNARPSNVAGLLKTMLETSVQAKRLRWGGFEAPINDADARLLNMVHTYANKIWTLPAHRVPDIAVDDGGKMTTLRDMIAEAEAKRAATLTAPEEVDVP